MISAEEKYKIALNVLASKGIENFMEEYSKAISTLHGFQSYQEMNPPIPPTTPQNDINSTISSKPIDSANGDQSASNTQITGKYDNL